MFFDVEKAFNMLWREDLFIKMHLLGIGRNMFNWILVFLSGRTFQNEIGTELSESYMVENSRIQEVYCHVHSKNMMAQTVQ